ncbi:MAG: hypothetical protein KF791_11265 [Verrucomicrobiae bacterium]|nr:hypothetical protein [Verrucomicrobiae bacterium]
MSSNADHKSPLADPLLILIAFLLLLATAATLYFIPGGASKSYVIEPGARPRPILTNQVVQVTVAEIVAAAPGIAPTAAPGTTPGPAAPAEPAKPATTPPAPAAAAVTAAAPVVTPTSDGRIRGRVILKGTPPPEKVIGAVKSDANCGKVAVGDAMTRAYVVGADGGLGYTLVRIVQAPSGAGKSAGPVLLDQEGCMYEPYVSAILAGETLTIRNSDPFMHNVNCTPKDPRNKGFNISQANKGQINEKVFETPELRIRFACNVHPWMIAFVHVLENPFFAVTDETGTFELPAGLPAGTYQLEAVHMRSDAVSQSITIAPDQGADVTFELAVSSRG